MVVSGMRKMWNAVTHERLSADPALVIYALLSSVKVCSVQWDTGALVSECLWRFQVLKPLEQCLFQSTPLKQIRHPYDIESPRAVLTSRTPSENSFGWIRGQQTLCVSNVGSPSTGNLVTQVLLTASQLLRKRRNWWGAERAIVPPAQRGIQILGTYNDISSPWDEQLRRP